MKDQILDNIFNGAELSVPSTLEWDISLPTGNPCAGITISPCSPHTPPVFKVNEPNSLVLILVGALLGYTLSRFMK